MRSPQSFYGLTFFAAIFFGIAADFSRADDAGESVPSEKPRAESVVQSYFLAPGAAHNERESALALGAVLFKRQAARLLAATPDENGAETLLSARTRADALRARIESATPDEGPFFTFGELAAANDRECEHFRRLFDYGLSILRFEAASAQYAESLRAKNPPPAQNNAEQNLARGGESLSEVERLQKTLLLAEELRPFAEASSTPESGESVELFYLEGIMLLRLAGLTNDRAERAQWSATARERLEMAASVNTDAARGGAIETALLESRRRAEEARSDAAEVTAESLYRDGRIQESVDLLVERLRKEPNDNAAKLLLADILESQKSEAARRRALLLAQSVTESAAEGSVEWFEGKERVVRLYLALGERERAKKIAAMLELVYPDCGDPERKARLDAMLTP